MKTPIEMTAPDSTTTPSTISERAPIKQLSSMMVGPACKGSNTPPIPTPPDKCTFLPICAQEPPRRRSPPRHAGGGERIRPPAALFQRSLVEEIEGARRHQFIVIDAKGQQH